MGRHFSLAVFMIELGCTHGKHGRYCPLLRNELTNARRKGSGVPHAAAFDGGFV
jgi:hypothetical protein